MTNFGNGQPIIGKAAIFDRPIYFKHGFAFYLFIMILIMYKFFKIKIIHGTGFANSILQTF
jgi:hypothetical protein